MKIRIRLRFKLLLSILFGATIVFSIFIFVINRRFAKHAGEQATEITSLFSQKYALMCKSYLDMEMGYSKSLANAFQNFQAYTEEAYDSIYGDIMVEMLRHNPQYLSVWSTMELSYLRDGYTKSYGRKSLSGVMLHGRPVRHLIYKDLEGDNVDGSYYKMKVGKIPVISEPYIDANVSEELMTSICYPVLIEDEFAGLAGVDLPLTSFQELIENLDHEYLNGVDILEGAQAFVVSNGGKIVGHTRKSNVNQYITDVYPKLDSAYNVTSYVKSGQAYTFPYESKNVNYYASIQPVEIVGTSTPWAFGVSIQIDKVLAASRKEMRLIIWIGLVGLVLLSIVSWAIASTVVKPLINTTGVFKDMSRGKVDLSMKLNNKSGDEIQDLSDSVNELIIGLANMRDFAKEIGAGNLDLQYKLLSDEDSLGKALIEMQDGLKMAKLEVERNNEKIEKQNWSSSGVAKFSELLRSDDLELKELMRRVLSELVSYTNSDQGGIFLINDRNQNDVFIEPVATYAYDEVKFNQQRIEIGEGLIGTCVKEKVANHLTEVPGTYVKISSGLGEHKPHNILIVPLINNKQVVGALELASLEHFEDHKIDFVEKVGQGIAATIISIKSVVRTNELLERTKVQAEEMLAQEEELRQNMEELQATQEESMRRTAELEKELKDLKKKKK